MPLAATSATNASNGASAAATSASNAATSETNAANSASAAAASAASAANTFDSFDDRYLGTKASNPTLDNDGNALLAGALYFSTSENIMKVYDGASWIAATSAGNVSFLRFRYVATSGQTTFSGSDSNSATLTYTVNNIVVFLNGVSLDQTEYTATSGTSVVLGAGAALNDELVIVAFKSFVTADMVPASTGGTYAGAVRFAAGSASVPSISVSGDTNTGIFYPAADTIAFAEGGAEALRINSSGTVVLSGGDTSANGTGITFPATQSASSNANTLDDYEEGTFTPTIVYSGTNTPTYSGGGQLGRYTKIGRIVEIQIYLSWNENGSTGNVTVGALPFTSVTSNARAVPSILSFGLTGLPTNISVTGFVNSNATTILLCLNDNAATVLTATYTDNDQDIYLTVTYEAA